MHLSGYKSTSQTSRPNNRASNNNAKLDNMRSSRLVELNNPFAEALKGLKK